MKKWALTAARRKVVWLVAAGLTVLSIGVGTALARSAATSGWPPAKAQIEEQQQQALALAQAHPQPKRASSGLIPASQAPPRRQAGILAMRQGPFLPTTFLVRNFWQGPVGSDWFLVYAGATPGSTGGSPTVGALRLYRETADLQLTEIGIFAASPSVGPLTITKASADVLDLRSDSGTILSFNLQTRQYQ